MSVINILLTHPDADIFEPFAHDDTTFKFSRITSTSLKNYSESPVWIFIDWVLEDMAGLELCRRLRADPLTAKAHITMVLDDEDIASRKRALDAGADDYMTGPVDRHIILDRILASKPTITNLYTAERFDYGQLTINLTAYRAFWRNSPIDVSPNEFHLLRFLAQNANRTLSRQDILSGLSKDENKIDERTVDVCIGRLRKALKAAGAGNILRTVRSVGYVLDL